MGSDLITTGFTHSGSFEGRGHALAKRLLSNPANTTLLLEKKQFIDFTRDFDFDHDDLSGVLLNGLGEAELLCREDQRYSQTWQMPNGYYFTVAGGSSWGDDPFDQFSNLNFFLDLFDVEGMPAGFVETLENATGIFGYGIKF